jgi:hypothetical protein
MGVTFRDRLIAFQVDGKNLPGAEAGYTPTGYQALALAPGVHTISYCHTTRSSLGTGVVMCKFKVQDFTFESDARYMVVENVNVSTGRAGSAIGETVSVRTNVVKMN